MSAMAQLVVKILEWMRRPALQARKSMMLEAIGGIQNSVLQSVNSIRQASAVVVVRRPHGGCAWNAHTTVMTTFPVARPDSE
jgi:uncharacterized protein with von Willebrand factor type A (vWA) domain